MAYYTAFIKNTAQKTEETVRMSTEWNPPSKLKYIHLEAS